MKKRTYEVLNSRLPGLGDAVTTSDGLKGEVHSVNVLRQTVKVIVIVDKDEKEIREYKVDQLKIQAQKEEGQRRRKTGRSCRVKETGSTGKNGKEKSKAE